MTTRDQDRAVVVVSPDLFRDSQAGGDRWQGAVLPPLSTNSVRYVISLLVNDHISRDGLAGMHDEAVEKFFQLLREPEFDVTLKWNQLSSGELADVCWKAAQVFHEVIVGTVDRARARGFSFDRLSLFKRFCGHKSRSQVSFETVVTGIVECLNQNCSQLQGVGVHRSTPAIRLGMIITKHQEVVSELNNRLEAEAKFD